MNNVFSLKRFCKIFRYDMQGIIAKNGLTILLTPAIVLVLVGLFNYGLYVLGAGDSNGVITVVPAFRLVVLAITHFILMLFMASGSYGFMTESRNNIGYLMLPVSALEKLLSMSVIYFIIIPVTIAITSIIPDFLLTLIHFGGFREYLDIAYYTNLVNKIIFVGYYESTILANKTFVILSSIIGFLTACSFTLLCAITYKRHKIILTMLTYLVLNTVFSFMSAPIIFKQVNRLSEIEYVDTGLVIAQISDTVNQTAVISIIACAIGFVIIMAGIYYRLRTIKS